MYRTFEYAMTCSPVVWGTQHAPPAAQSDTFQLANQKANATLERLGFCVGKCRVNPGNHVTVQKNIPVICKVLIGNIYHHFVRSEIWMNALEIRAHELKHF